MIRCSKCVLLETWPGIVFDKEGVCNVCREHEKKVAIDWNLRQESLLEILEVYRNRAKKRGNKYDCLVGFSGGKDTVYTLWAMKKKYGMRPLAFTFDHGFKLSPDAEYNIQEIPKIIDIDHIRFSIGNGLRNALCRKASEVMGDFCWHCHNGVGAMPARISMQWEIPLQVWGEPTAEYQTTGTEYSFDNHEEQNEEHFRKVFQGGITPDMVLPEGYTRRDLGIFDWPGREICFEGDNMPEIRFEPYKPIAIYLGNYEPWDQIEHAKIIQKELGWKPYPYKDFDPELIRTWGNYRNWDKVDCPFETIRNWQKFLRRGLDKIAFQASKDIRDGLITREQGLELLKYEGQEPINFDQFTQETGISKEELERITKRL